MIQVNTSHLVIGFFSNWYRIDTACYVFEYIMMMMMDTNHYQRQLETNTHRHMDVYINWMMVEKEIRKPKQNLKFF